MGAPTRGDDFAKFSEKLHKIGKCLAFARVVRFTSDKGAKRRNRKFISSVGLVFQFHRSVVGSFYPFDVPAALAVETGPRVIATAGSSRWLAAVSHMAYNTLLFVFYWIQMVDGIPCDYVTQKIHKNELQNTKIRIPFIAKQNTMPRPHTKHL